MARRLPHNEEMRQCHTSAFGYAQDAIRSAPVDLKHNFAEMDVKPLLRVQIFRGNIEFPFFPLGIRLGVVFQVDVVECIFQ